MQQDFTPSPDGASGRAAPDSPKPRNRCARRDRPPPPARPMPAPFEPLRASSRTAQSGRRQSRLTSFRRFFLHFFDLLIGELFAAFFAFPPSLIPALDRTIHLGIEIVGVIALAEKQMLQAIVNLALSCHATSRLAAPSRAMPSPAAPRGKSNLALRCRASTCRARAQRRHVMPCRTAPRRENLAAPRHAMPCPAPPRRAQPHRAVKTLPCHAEPCQTA